MLKISSSEFIILSIIIEDVYQSIVHYLIPTDACHSIYYYLDVAPDFHVL